MQIVMSSDVGLIDTIDKIITKTEDGIISDLDKILYDAKSSLESSKASIEAEYEEILDNGKKEAEKIEKQIIGSSNLEARNKQLSLVEEAISSAFGQALDKLRSSKSNPDLLKSLIKQATDMLGTTKVTISANSKDTDAVKLALKDFNGSTFDPTPIECLGGIIARSSDGNMTFDNTIDTRLDRLKPLIRKEIALKFRLD
ncbi:MAG: V-type ATP synthase subunit E [Cenarchaeum symbiont of Oopsacas minuta]|nr:V-type ATP synthase subunit E [Cenarchaeum symbiont of Oopsacas minuta]